MTVVAQAWWRSYAAVYDWLWAVPLGAAMARRVAGLVTGRGGVVVDVGGGTGLLSAHLRARGHHVICVDQSPHMLRRAAHRDPVPGCVQGRAEALPLADACADVVVAMNILHLHPNPGQVLGECLRVLRPGGRLLCSWPRGTTGVVDVARAESRLGLGAAAVLARAATRVAIHATAVATRAAHRTDEADIVAALRAASSHIHWTELPAYAQTLAIVDLPCAAGPAAPSRSPKETPCRTRPPGETSPSPTAS